MTQEDKDKDLLLKYLCMALPYGVILSIGVFDNGTMKYHNEKLDYHSKLLSLIELEGAFRLNGLLYKYSQFIAKPYLRPMSSMTEEEFEEYGNIIEHISIGSLDFNIANPDAFDWLNAHHFDYRGLIEKGLAIKVTKENNPYK